MVGIKVLYEGAPAAGAFSGLSGNPYSTAPILISATITFTDALNSFRTPTLLGGMAPTSADYFSCSQSQGNGHNPLSPPSDTAAQLPRGMWLGEIYRPETDYIYGSPNRYDAPQTKAIELRCSSNSLFELQYMDGIGTWRTYQRFSRFGMGSTTPGYKGRGVYGFANDWKNSGNPNLPLNSPNYPAYQILDIAQLAVSTADPRSHRFGLMAMFLDPPTGGGVQQPDVPDGWTYYLKQGWWPSGTGNSYQAMFNPANVSRFYPSWSSCAAQNPWANRSGMITNPTSFLADEPGSGTNYYKDMDGVARRGDGDFANNVRPCNSAAQPGHTRRP